MSIPQLPFLSTLGSPYRVWPWYMYLGVYCLRNSTGEAVTCRAMEVWRGSEVLGGKVQMECESVCVCTCTCVNSLE